MSWRPKSPTSRKICLTFFSCSFSNWNVTIMVWLWTTDVHKNKTIILFIWTKNVLKNAEMFMRTCSWERHVHENNMFMRTTNVLKNNDRFMSSWVHEFMSVFMSGSCSIFKLLKMKWDWFIILENIFWLWDFIISYIVNFVWVQFSIHLRFIL